MCLKTKWCQNGVKPYFYIENDREKQLKIKEEPALWSSTKKNSSSLW